jgi:hypothetical protein
VRNREPPRIVDPDTVLALAVLVLAALGLFWLANNVGGGLP